MSARGSLVFGRAEGLGTPGPRPEFRPAAGWPWRGRGPAGAAPDRSGSGSAKVQTGTVLSSPARSSVVQVDMYVCERLLSPDRAAER